jgi:pimeloyl-ACP methyl ester carboxylesterase
VASGGVPAPGASGLGGELGGVIEYDEVGSGPPVVLLRGLLMDHTLWDRVLPLLPEGLGYLRPVLPLGAHRRAMNPGADLTLAGQVRLVAGLLGALGLDDVTLVYTDWGGALFVTFADPTTGWRGR